MENPSRIIIFFLTLIFLFSISELTGQVTTSSIRGSVVDHEGNPLPGANVIARHEPSGTTAGAATRSDGRFNIENLRPGGPYTVTASFIGFTTQTKENVYLELGQEVRIDFTLVDTAIEIDDVIEVIGQIHPVLSPGRTGAARNISTIEIESIPTIGREIWDFTRLTPKMDGLTAAGQNIRYNQIKVDGAVLNDVFGLPATGTPGGQVGANPIAMDAIEEFQVNIAPFDVRQSGFTGAAINAITRSGSNTFTGSTYFYGRNQNFINQRLGPERAAIEEFDEYHGGFRLGGPIVRDRTFFFTSGEIKRRSDPLDVGLLGSGAATEFEVPVSLIEDIRSMAQELYGYMPGGYDFLARRENDIKLFLRLDHNLSENHRLTFRHNFVDAILDRGVTRHTSTFDFADRQYEFASRQNSSVLQLNSSWSPNLVSQMRLVYTTIRDHRDYGNATPFPSVLIRLPEDRQIRFGMERFSQANRLDQDLIEITAHATYFTGNHSITFGTDNEIFFFDNLFIQDHFGTYEFDSIEDFQAGRPSRYQYSYSLTDNPLESARWAAAQMGFFAQNEWEILPTLNLMFGVRLDIPLFIENPLYNPLFEEEFGLRTDEVPGSRPLWSPRFGFNWNVTGDRRTQMRGGVGIFTGRPPFVWISNQYSNTGVDFARIDLRPWHFEEGEFPEGFFSPDPYNQPRPAAGEIQTTEINITDPNFRFPQTLRASLAIDQQLPFDFVGTVEFLYSNKLNEITYKNLNFGEPIGVNPVDGRPIYSRDRRSPYFTDVLYLGNTNQGYDYHITTQIQRTPREGWYGSVAYTYGRAWDINSGTSLRAVSNWQFNPHPGDSNNPPLTTSNYERRHRIVGNIAYQFNLAPRWTSTIALIYESRSGRPFSYVYFGDLTQDGSRSNDLVYVPQRGDEDLFILTTNNWDEVHTFIDNDPVLSKYRGQIVPRNAGREPWRHRVDLRFTQNIPTMAGQRLQLTLDIINVLNLLNSEWGHFKYHSFQEFTLFGFHGYDTATGKPRISFIRGTDPDEAFITSDMGSRWQAQVGIRYTF